VSVVALIDTDFARLAEPVQLRWMKTRALENGSPRQAVMRFAHYDGARST
jgi:hypothetical protein